MGAIELDLLEKLSLSLPLPLSPPPLPLSVLGKFNETNVSTFISQEISQGLETLEKGNR